MAFAVELHLDDDNAASIGALTAAIYAQCGGENLMSSGAHPHISLAGFAQIDLAQISARLADFAATTAVFGVTLAAIGVFPTTGVVYLAPVVTQQLLTIHSRFQRMLEPLGLPSNAYYWPGNWMPHCTVGLNVPADKIGHAVLLCQQAPVFRTVTLTRMRLIEVWPVREIFTFNLR